MDMVTVKVKPSARDIFAYKMYHTFISFAGVGRILFSLIFLALGFGTAGRTETYLTVLVFAIALLNLAVTPALFLYQAARDAGRAKPVTWTFSGESLVANDGDTRVELSWGSLALVVWLRSELFLYTAPAQALVLPRRQLEGRDAELMSMTRAAVAPGRFVKRRFL